MTISIPFLFLFLVVFTYPYLGSYRHEKIIGKVFSKQTMRAEGHELIFFFISFFCCCYRQQKLLLLLLLSMQTTFNESHPSVKCHLHLFDKISFEASPNKPRILLQAKQKRERQRGGRFIFLLWIGEWSKQTKIFLQFQRKETQNFIWEKLYFAQITNSSFIQALSLVPNSVTEWLDYFSIFGHLQLWKFAQ